MSFMHHGLPDTFTDESGIMFAPFAAQDEGGTDAATGAAAGGAVRIGAQGQGGGTAVTDQAVAITYATPAPTLVTTPGSGLQINLIWDTSVGTINPLLLNRWQNDVISAAKFLEQTFTNSVRLNFQIGYQEVGGASLDAKAAAQTHTWYGGYTNALGYQPTIWSYSAMRAALAYNASTGATDTAMLASLPTSNPLNGSYILPYAEQRALGLVSQNDAQYDAQIGFGAASLFTFGMTNTTGTVSPGKFDFFATALHEMTEGMGRIIQDSAFSGSTPLYTLMNLGRYTGAGSRGISAGGFYSINGGVSGLGDLNAVEPGDHGDWASTVPNDALDAFATPGVLEAFTGNDIAVMDSLGWNLTGSTPASHPAIKFTADTATLAAAQGGNGLSASVGLMTATLVSPQPGDKINFTVSSPGNSFVSASSGLTSALISSGDLGVAGTLTGDVYKLTVVATDATNARVYTSALDVVAANQSSNALQVASLVGSSATSSPTFIYGLGGGDTLDGTGMNGPLFFDGGGSGDLMVGGAGGNTFLYGATTDSTPVSADLIQHFSVATDRIDLTGIGATGLVFGGQIGGTATNVAAHNIAFQQVTTPTGAQTKLYVNTGSSTEVVAATDMQINFQGALPLKSGNILHA